MMKKLDGIGRPTDSRNVNQKRVLLTLLPWKRDAGVSSDDGNADLLATSCLSCSLALSSSSLKLVHNSRVITRRWTRLIALCITYWSPTHAPGLISYLFIYYIIYIIYACLCVLSISRGEAGQGESRGPDAPRQQNQSDSWDFHKPCQNSKYYSSGYGVSPPSWFQWFTVYCSSRGEKCVIYFAPPGPKFLTTSMSPISN